MVQEGDSEQGTPDELRHLLLKLAEEGSMEDLQRIEALFRITKEARELSQAGAQARLESSNERHSGIVTAMSESLKLHFEAYKNLTVLDSGSLVAFALVTHNLVPSPVQQYWLDTAYSLVLFSLVASLTMTFIIGGRMFDVMRPDTPPDTKRRRVWEIVVLLVDGLAAIGFVLGLGLFLQFLNVNL